MKMISQTEFNKKIDMEFAYLSHVDRMPSDAAKQQAVKNVSKEYQVG